MAYGSFYHNKIQLGRESTPGTPVNATVIWRGGFAAISDERQREMREPAPAVINSLGTDAGRAHTRGFRRPGSLGLFRLGDAGRDASALLRGKA